MIIFRAQFLTEELTQGVLEVFIEKDYLIPFFTDLWIPYNVLAPRSSLSLAAERVEMRYLTVSNFVMSGRALIADAELHNEREDIRPCISCREPPRVQVSMQQAQYDSV
ncbi:MAG: hypothetical protein ACQEXV_04030 [Bacillota bacterium]